MIKASDNGDNAMDQNIGSLHDLEPEGSRFIKLDCLDYQSQEVEPLIKPLEWIELPRNAQLIPIECPSTLFQKESSKETQLQN